MITITTIACGLMYLWIGLLALKVKDFEPEAAAVVLLWPLAVIGYLFFRERP